MAKFAKPTFHKLSSCSRCNFYIFDFFIDCMENRIFARYLDGLFSMSEQFQKFLGNSSEGLRKLSVCGGVLVGIYKNFLYFMQ